MNIIANNCIGGRIYKLFKTKYNNPFIWCSIKTEDFIKLYTNYDIINFDNIKCELIKNININIGINNSLCPRITIDSMIEVYYFHYIQDNNYTIPTRNGVNIFYNNIIKYCVDKYFDRTNRMKEQNEKPFFIFNQSIHSWYNYYDIIKDNNISNFNIINYSQYKQLPNNIYKIDLYEDTAISAEKIIPYIKKYI